MKQSFAILNPKRLRNEIIVAFCFVTVIVVLVTARVSYLFVKDLYVEQLNEQVNIITRSVAGQFDKRYVNLLSLGTLSEGSLGYFNSILEKNILDNSVQEAFIFDYNFKLLAHSDKRKPLNTIEAGLMLNKVEIDVLDINASIASLPFKGKDGNWYMWGFYRLTESNWLGVRESASRLSRVENFELYFWLIGFGGIVFTILAGFIVAKRIVAPVNKLIAFSRQIGERNFEVEKPEVTAGELKILADAMEDMKNSLSRHHKEKEEMLAKIAHEIRNPLGGIELLANLVKEDLTKEKFKTEYIVQILKEVAQLKVLITNYLNFSKPVNSNPEIVNVANVVNDAINIVKNKLVEKKIKLIFPGTEEKVWFDPVHLRNVILNLVSNSIDAVNGNGEISIGYKRNENNFEIDVSNNGKVIPEKERSEIFEPFFTTKKEGTGLGLSISKKLCIENNADLYLKESSTGRTCFTIKMKNKNE